MKKGGKDFQITALILGFKELLWVFLFVMISNRAASWRVYGCRVREWIELGIAGKNCYMVLLFSRILMVIQENDLKYIIYSTLFLNRTWKGTGKSRRILYFKCS